MEFSLLNNPAAFTVRVATFRGDETMDLEEIEQWQDKHRGSSKLAEAAEKANRVTTALRRQGFEAYEFHDRHESYVTVGSFESMGRTLETGAVEMNPMVHQIMEKFRARQETLPGGGAAGLVPVRVDGISLDVQPLPIEVPQRSAASVFSASRR